MVKETFSDRIIQAENISTVRSFATGALMALAIPFGVPALIATGMTSVAIDYVAGRMETKTQQKALLRFYRDQVAALQHKSPDAVTLEDLQQVAKPAEEGGKGVSTLKKELDDYDLHQRYMMGFGAVSSALMTGSLIALSVAFPTFLAGGMSLVLGLGLAGLGYNLISQGVQALGKMMFGGHEHKIENGVHQRMMSLAEDIKKEPASAVEVFGLIAQAKPALQEGIVKRFGHHYDHLTVLQKKQAVELFEPQVRAIALTEAINAGEITPALAGFIITGNCGKELPGYDKYKALFQSPPAQLSANEQQTQSGKYGALVRSSRAESTKTLQ